MQGSSPEEFQEAMISLRRPEVLAIGFDWTVLTCPHWFSTSSTHQHRALVGKLALRHCMPQLQAHRDTGYAEICHWETNHTLLGCQAWAEDLRQLKSTQFCRQLIYLLLKATHSSHQGGQKSPCWVYAPPHVPWQPREKTYRRDPPYTDRSSHL